MGAQQDKHPEVDEELMILMNPHMSRLQDLLAFIFLLWASSLAKRGRLATFNEGWNTNRIRSKYLQLTGSGL